jgi:hemerythrin-like domain-containing protein
MSNGYGFQRDRAHPYDRQSLELLHVAVSSTVCPPAGHAFFSLLRNAADYFAHELPRHIEEEERQHFGRIEGGDESPEIPGLCEEHQALMAQAAEFARLVNAFLAAPSDEAWRVVRGRALALEAQMRRHLAHEEEVLRRRWGGEEARPATG